MTDNKDKKLDKREGLLASRDNDLDDDLFESDKVSELMDFEDLDIPDDIDSDDILAAESEEGEVDISYMFADDLIDDNDTGDLANASDRVISADAGKKKKVIVGAVALLVILAVIGMGTMMFMGSSEQIAEDPAPVVGSEEVDGGEASNDRASESKPTAAPAPVAVMPAPVAATKPEPSTKPEPVAKPVAKPVARTTSSSGASFGITGVRFQSEGGIEGVIIETSSDPTGNYKSFFLSEPQRIVVDVLNAKKSFSGNQLTPGNSSFVSSIRYASHPDKVRIVVDLIGNVPNWKLSINGNSLRINMQ